MPKKRKPPYVCLASEIPGRWAGEWISVTARGTTAHRTRDDAYRNLEIAAAERPLLVKPQRRPNLTHLLRAMKAGDVIYLPESKTVLDRQIVSVVTRNEGKASTAIFVAVNADPASAHRVIRVEMITPLR